MPAKLSFPSAQDEAVLAAVKQRSSIDYGPYIAGISQMQAHFAKNPDSKFAYVDLDNTMKAKIERGRFIAAGKQMNPQVGVRFHKNSTDQRLIVGLGPVRTRKKRAAKAA